MGIPQVPDQVKRAPTLALRAMFSGIGRILVPADRPQAQATAAEPATQPSPASQPGQAERQRTSARRPHRSAAAPSDQASSRWRSLDQTGNVRLLSAEDLNDDYDALPPTSKPAEDALAVTESVTAGQLTDQSVAEQPVADQPDAAAPDLAVRDLPLAGYDNLSLPSIRARLRGLDVSQLRALLDYEATNAERPEVLGMFERRIEKLESGG